MKLPKPMRFAGPVWEGATCFFLLAFLWTFQCRAVFGQTESSLGTQQHASYPSYYVCKGDVLQPVDGDPTHADYGKWEVWLYSQSMRVSPSRLGLGYVRWGVIQGSSARAVMEQTAAYSQFELAYTSFFGTNTWGRFTFSFPVGPIAIPELGHGDDPYGLHSKIDLLNYQLGSVVGELRPSLVNADHSEATASVQQYFEQVRRSMQEVARFYDKLSRLPAERNYLAQELALLTPGVSRAESAVPKVRAILPSVRLPVRKDWMTHTEAAGREGTVNVTVTEMVSSAWVRQNWTGGDGSMSGTEIVTIIPYQDIGDLNLRTLDWGNGQRWSLSIQPANPNGFSQSVKSPERTTAKRSYPAVDIKTSEKFLFLEFSNSSDAQDAYAYFRYHKERGL
jgi:hypothetical protein